MKLLLYCTKKPHKLYHTERGFVLSDFKLGSFYKEQKLLNGKIVAECDYEIDDIFHSFKISPYCTIDSQYCTSIYDYYCLLKSSCLTEEEIKSCLGNGIGNIGRAIHIENPHIFDRAKELNECWSIKYPCRNIEKAPSNMMRVNYSFNQELTIMKKKIDTTAVEEYILISVRPDCLFRILKGEQTIIVKKKVLKEMIE